MQHERRGCVLAAAWLAVALLLFARVTSGADEVSVPIGLQAELVAKVAEYDRNFVPRAGDQAHILIVVKQSNADSVHVGAQLEAAFSRLGAIAGLAHDEAVVSFANAADLVAACRSRRAAIVVFGPGFGDDVDAIRGALTGVDILSVSSVPDYVPKGIVLGFDVVSGRPKLLVNLTQAKLQRVDLRSEVLKLMKVYE
jgi:hypothetical protein